MLRTQILVLLGLVIAVYSAIPGRISEGEESTAPVEVEDSKNENVSRKTNF